MEGESSTSHMSPESSQSPSPSKTSRESGIELLRSAGCLHPRLSVDAYLLETFTWHSAYTSSCASSSSGLDLDNNQDDVQDAESVVDSEARDSLELVRVMARTEDWFDAGVVYSDIEEGVWFSGAIGEPGPHGCQSGIATARLDRWIEGLGENGGNVGEHGLAHGRRSSLGDEESSEVISDGSELALMQHEQELPTMQHRRASNEVRVIQRSCVSDKTRVKKGSKLFRARRRIANLFRRVERPVDSVIAAERFRIE